MGKARQIELTSKSFRLMEPEVFNKGSKEVIMFYAETWFDADKYFGSEIGEENADRCWINLYINYDPIEDEVTATITVNGTYKLAKMGASCDGDEIEWELTPEEQKMFKEAITQFAVEGYGSLEKFIEMFK